MVADPSDQTDQTDQTDHDPNRGRNRQSKLIPVLVGTWPSEHRSNFAAELCQHHNNTVAPPIFSCPNSSTRPYDTDSDSEPEPEPASPLNFSGDLWSEDSCHRGHREHRGTSHFPSGKVRSVPADGKRKNLSVNSVPSVAKDPPQEHNPSASASRQ
ncbi:MAG: hypothetical protein ACOX52_14010 [Verrucomicrobiota bacterium]